MPIKGSRKRKVRKLSESDESDSTTLPQMNSDILNKVKKNMCVSQV